LSESRKAKEKNEEPRKWVLRMIGACLVFEIAGAMISMAITGGNLYMALVFGFVCGVGGFLLVKYKLDQVQPKKEEHWSDRMDNNQ